MFGPPLQESQSITNGSPYVFRYQSSILAAPSAYHVLGRTARHKHMLAYRVDADLVHQIGRDLPFLTCLRINKNCYGNVCQEKYDNKEIERPG